jgi:hypothetical protein
MLASRGFAARGLQCKAHKCEGHGKFIPQVIVV